MKRISQIELNKRTAAGARVFTKKDQSIPQIEQPKAESKVEIEFIDVGMAPLAATIAAYNERQLFISERIADELERFNSRTRAIIKVTKRTDKGGIDAAEIEIIESGGDL